MKKILYPTNTCTIFAYCISNRIQKLSSNMNSRTSVNLARNWFTFILKMGKLRPKKRKKQVIRPLEKKSKYSRSLISSIMPHILERKQQTSLDATIQHYFLCLFIQMETFKEDGRFLSWRGNQDVLCSVLQSKTKDSNSSGYTITGIIWALFAFKKFQW